MDVRCNRCGTDYEFDDDLISDRGTTVQCTNCGYQFKIYPERTTVKSPERWTVHTMDGREIVYTSLRNLQRAIGEHQVGPKDLLSRGNQPSRPLGSIPELEPFFTSAPAPKHGNQSSPRTLHGVAPPAPATAPPRPEPEVRRPMASTQKSSAPPVGTPRAAPVGHVPTLPGGNVAPPEFAQQQAPARVFGIDPVAQTERQPPNAQAPSKPPAVHVNAGNTKLGMGSTQRSGTPSDVAKPFGAGATVRIDTKPKPDFDATMPAAAPPRAEPPATSLPQVAPKQSVRQAPLPTPAPSLDRTMPVPSQPVVTSPVSSGPLKSSPRAAPTPEPPPTSTRDRLASYDELPFEEHIDPARRARSRWIAGVVFLAVVGLLGATLGRQYLVRLSTGHKPDAPQRDDRATSFLQEGLRLLDQADYDGAQEQLAKAQAVSDRDPAVLAAVARLETVRADMEWLKLRLLDPTEKENVQATTRELTRRAGRARQAVDSAFTSTPDDPMVVRSRIDAMRIAGEEGKAREWIAPIAANASDPQNAYVLAALDLSEAAPAFGTVIDRLRAAAVSEHETIRARGALIYALVRAGRALEAETELAKVTGGEHPHPLASELKGFVERFSAPLDAGADGAAVVSSAAASAAAAPSSAAASGTAPGGAGTVAGGDFRARLTQAAQASSRGDYTRARDLYLSVMNEQPGNTEALAGLGDVAHRQGDNATAARFWGRVLDVNPSYLPALMGLADYKWSSGDRAGALGLYKRVLEHGGSSSDYGQHAQARINEAQSTKDTSSSSAPAEPKPSAPSTADTADLPQGSHPDIDTTDLPGAKAP